MMNEPDQKPLRNEKGQLLPGYTANPHGRPPGPSLLSLLKQHLFDCPDEQRESRGNKFVKDIYDRAMRGDNTCQKLIWHYIEGMPKQDVNVEGTGLPFVINIQKDDRGANS